MTITINSQPHEFPDEALSVSELLQKLALGYPVLVELNGMALFEREFVGSAVRDGDRLELLRVAAGG